MDCQKPSARKKGKDRRYSVLWGWLLRAHCTPGAVLLVDKGSLLGFLPSSGVSSLLREQKRTQSVLRWPCQGLLGCSSLHQLQPGSTGEG